MRRGKKLTTALRQGIPACVNGGATRVNEASNEKSSIGGVASSGGSRLWSAVVDAERGPGPDFYRRRNPDGESSSHVMG